MKTNKRDCGLVILKASVFNRVVTFMISCIIFSHLRCYLSFILIGNFDPKAMSNFYDNIQPGPVVPPKPCKKGKLLQSYP